MPFRAPEFFVALFELHGSPVRNFVISELSEECSKLRTILAKLTGRLLLLRILLCFFSE